MENENPSLTSTEMYAAQLASTPTPPTLSREDVFAEMERVASDPAHPMHNGWKIQSEAYERWCNGLYRRLPGVGSGTIEFGKLSNVEGFGPGVEVLENVDADAAHAELQRSVAAELEQRGLDVNVISGEGMKLFSGKQGEELISLFDERTLTGLAPTATRLAHIEMAAWMSELAALRNAPTAESEVDEVDPSAFQTQYVAELQKRGVNVEQLDNAVEALFVGRPELYKYFIKQLDKFPPSTRLEAYLRSAQTVMHYVKLRQYVS